MKQLLNMINVKKGSICLIIGLILFLMTLTVVVVAPPGSIMKSVQQEPNEKVAETNVTVTLSDTETTYQRKTVVGNVEDAGIGIEDYVVIAELTTHDDMYFEIHAEFSTTVFQDNFTEFKNSFEVKHFQRLDSIQEIVPVNISLLENTSSSLDIFHDNHTQSNQRFIIDQRVIIRQTTVFLLTLPEPFMFDLNKMELGQLSDLHFKSEYHYNKQNDFGHFEEELRIKSPGSAIEYVPHTKGYSGYVYMKRWEDERGDIPEFHRRFAHVPNQMINLQIKLPVQQDIACSFYSEYDESPEVTKNGNVATIQFEPDSTVPYYIKISSEIPILEQFSITEYAAAAFAALAGLIGFVKGLPYFWNRRSFNGYKKGIQNTISKGDFSDFVELEKTALDKFFNGKLSTNQYEEIRRIIRLLKQSQETLSKVDRPSKPKEPLETQSHNSHLE